MNNNKLNAIPIRKYLEQVKGVLPFIFRSLRYIEDPSESIATLLLRFYYFPA